MADGLSFSLEDMRTLASDVATQEKQFKDGVEQIKALVEKIHEIWTSEETGTYEEFKALFDAKYPNLLDGDAMMVEFKNLVERKADDFEDAANRSKAAFE